MPAGGGETFQRRSRRCSLIKVIRLWIELRRETLDVFARHQLIRTPEAHADAQVIEPFDHPHLLRNTRDPQLRHGKLTHAEIHTMGHTSRAAFGCNSIIASL